MKSKTSLFNSSIFCKNIKRTWPLWGLVTFCFSMVPLATLLDGIRHGMNTMQMRSLYYSITAEGLPFVSLFFAIAAAMAVWNYLYTPKSVSMYHSIPVTRTNLYVTSYVSGLTVMLIPYVFTTILMFLVSLLLGVGGFGTLMMTLAAAFCETVLFFSIATFVAHLVGHIVALPVLYFVVNLYAWVLAFLVRSVMCGFLYGLTSDGESKFTVFSPLVYLVSNVSSSWWAYASESGMEDFTHASLENGYLVWIYGAVGVVLSVISHLLYRKRKSETAGDVVAFPLLKTIVTIMLSVVGTIIGAFALYWVFVDTTSDFYSLAPFMLAMVVAGIISYFVVLMLVEKKIRVFNKKSCITVSVLSAVYVAMLVLIATDAFGVENYIPKPSDIKTVSVTVGNVNFELDAEEDRELVLELMDVQKSLIDAKEELTRQRWFYMDAYEDNSLGAFMSIYYCLDNGNFVDRSYSFRFDLSELEREGSFPQKFKAFLENREITESMIDISDYDVLVITAEIHRDFPEPEDCMDLYQGYYEKDAEELLAAIRKDAEEGNFSAFVAVADVDYNKYADLNYYRFAGLTFSVESFYDYEFGTESSYDWFKIPLTESMENTIDFLASREFASREFIEKALTD